MSDTTVQTATTEPAQVAKPSVEKKGAGNESQNEFARRLAARQTPPQTSTAQTAEAKTEPAKVEAKADAAAPETGEAKEAPNAEAKDEGTKTEAGAEETAPADTAEETTDDAEEVLSTETHSLDPKLQRKIDRRIGKEVAKRKALEQEVASLKALITQPPATEEKEVVISAPANVPLAEIATPAELDQLKMTAKQEIRWAEQWLDEEIPAEGIQTDRGLATKKQLKELKRNAQVVLEDLVPQREKFLSTRQTAQQAAFEQFPFLKDPAHPGYKLAQQAKREGAGWLAGLPNADYIVGVQVTGLLAMQAAKAPNGKADTKPAIKPKAVPTRGQSEIASDASISRTPTGLLGANALQAERARITGGKKSFGQKDFAQLLIANAKFRNSQ